MYLLEKASNNFAEKIADELEYDSEKKAVIAYGTYAILQIGISILFVIIFGLIFGVMFQALVASITGALMRKYAGGAHASSPTICIIVGTAVCIGIGLLSRLTVFTNIGPTTGLVLAVHIIAFWLIARLAPVASANKPIPEKRRPKMKRNGLILNMVYLFIGIGLIAVSRIYEKPALMAFSVCIALSVLWQMFSITRIGNVTLGALDRLLSGNKAK